MVRRHFADRGRSYSRTSEKSERQRGLNASVRYRTFLA
jgi:hypothetical protein